MNRVLDWVPFVEHYGPEMTKAFHKRHYVTQAVRRAIRTTGVVRSKDVRVGQSVGADKARRALRSLERRGEVIHVARGVYQAGLRTTEVGRSPLMALAGILAGEDYYISWWYAMAHHGLTEQMPRRIAVAVAAKRRPQTVAGYEVRFVRLADLTLEGTEEIEVSGVRVRMATREKAVLDSLDRLDLGGGLSEVVKALVSGRINIPKLVKLALRRSSERDLRRLGYLLAALGLGQTELLAKRVGSGPYVPLDLRRPDGGSTDATWRIRDNVGLAVLRRWSERDT